MPNCSPSICHCYKYGNYKSEPLAPDILVFYCNLQCFIAGLLVWQSIYWFTCFCLPLLSGVWDKWNRYCRHLLDNNIFSILIAIDSVRFNSLIILVVFCFIIFMHDHMQYISRFPGGPQRHCQMACFLSFTTLWGRYSVYNIWHHEDMTKICCCASFHHHKDAEKSYFQDAWLQSEPYKK